MPAISFSAHRVPNIFRDRERLRKWVHSVAKDHGIGVGELNFVLLGESEMLEYNRRYLQHDDHTDVIAFDGQTGTGVSGDVLISSPRIRENAATFGTPVQQELRRVMVHALLHLLGHSDKSRAKKLAMQILEDKYLEQYR
ncbi:MAG: rRNA maturation RNase YbeY [Flavobacteriales bacterium]|nr:rRNA maturation RNase YbeY [Flavobacteriales bacterium]MCC6937948.1 rRNA maturation RNase YbeY [Flavobacteriales bacterium]